MKKTVIVLLALFVPASLWAMDIDQGKFELAGKTALNYSDTTNEVSGQPDRDQTSFSVQLDGNYYFMKNFGLGLIFDYTELTPRPKRERATSIQARSSSAPN